MATFDPPWRLDPTQNIVNVHWADQVDDIWIILQFIARDDASTYSDPELTNFILRLDGAGGPTIVTHNVDFHYIPISSVFYPYQDLRQYRYNTMREDASPDVSARYLVGNTVSVQDLERFLAIAFQSGAALVPFAATAGSIVAMRNQAFLINATQAAGGINSSSLSLIARFRHGAFFQSVAYNGPSWLQIDSFKLVDPTKPLGTALVVESRSFGSGDQQFYFRNVVSNGHHLHTVFNGIDYRGSIIQNGAFFVTCDLATGELF
jgi:hypothetical protein